MAHSLRVLIVEDSEDDRDLLVRELQRAGYEVSSERVETARAMRAALERQEWDVIFADYSMPRFSAPEALSLLKKIGLELPFIIVSGTVGEEIAVESMKAGAHDYLPKGKLQRLVPALERELGQARQRRARRQAEEESRRLASIVESSTDAIVLTDLSGAVVSWNRGAERMYGYTAGEMKGKPISILETPARRGELAALLESVRGGKDVQRYEGMRMRKDGSTLEVAVSLFPVSSALGEVVGAASVARDITERKKTEGALRESESRKAGILRSAMDAIISMDKEGRIIEFNPAAERIFGYSRTDAVGHVLSDLIVPPSLRDRHRAGLAHYLATGDAPILGKRLEMPGMRADGTEFPTELTIVRIESDGPPVFTGFLRDLTERVLLEAQLRQSQKMEAVGRLAGGVAHDFNNLLTTILGYSDLLMEKSSHDSSLRESVEEIKKAGERAATLTRQLLAFSRKQVLTPVVLDLNEVVTDLEKMMRRLIGEDIEMATVLDPSLANVRADPGQLEQVIMNLVVNSRDAMPHGGRLTIETKNVKLDKAYSREHAYVAPGPYVLLAVSDTGTGMGPETRSHIFEPFFTTKGLGKGTGLGLSTVYGIIKQTGGSIEVYSEVGQGTSFKIYLPPVEEAVQRVAPSPPAKPALGSETILLVEDEEGVRALTRRVLTTYGYSVLEAPSGEDAMEVAQKHRGVIHLMVTDAVMPGMSGPQLARQLSSLRPDMRVLFISGYTDDAIVRHGLLKPTEAFLQKPFSPDALVRKIREVLQAAPPVAGV